MSTDSIPRNVTATLMYDKESLMKLAGSNKNIIYYIGPN